MLLCFLAGWLLARRLVGCLFQLLVVVRRLICIQETGTHVPTHPFSYPRGLPRTHTHCQAHITQSHQTIIIIIFLVDFVVSRKFPSGGDKRWALFRIDSFQAFIGCSFVLVIPFLFCRQNIMHVILKQISFHKLQLQLILFTCSSRWNII